MRIDYIGRQYFTDSGIPNGAGSLLLDVAEGEKTTWSDVNLTIPNPVRIPLDWSGRSGNIFGKYRADIYLLDFAESVLDNRTYYPGETGQPFGPWVKDYEYRQGAIVTYNSKVYISQIDGNENNPPDLSSDWAPIGNTVISDISIPDDEVLLGASGGFTSTPIPHDHDGLLLGVMGGFDEIDAPGADTDFLDGSFNWRVPDPMKVKRMTRTTAMTVIEDYQGYLIKNTGTYVVSLLPEMPEGFWCFLEAGADSEITLRANPGTSIDGLTEYIQYSGEIRLLYRVGSEYKTIVLRSFRQDFLSSGSFVCPPGYQLLGGWLWGGGGGGVQLGPFGPGGGGGGACTPIYVLDLVPGESMPIVVGAGGVYPGSGQDGGNGGNTTFAGFESQGGRGSTAQGLLGGGGGYPYNIQANDFNNNLWRGSTGVGSESPTTVAPLVIYGGAGGGGVAVGSVTGLSLFGGDGRSGSGSPPREAQVPGGGGFGLGSPHNGDGAAGKATIWGIC